MADAGLLIGWNRVVPGRDPQAVELWGEMLQYLVRLHAEGHIASFEPVLLGAYGGSLNGFVLVRGEQDKLDHVRNSEEFLQLNIRANKTLEGFLVVRAHFGSDAARILRLYGTV
ncbi:MAG: hypothetical protein KC621_18180 [Myxococcales bacterium]|nr:hypothetical protein [Myxococcales bacterium]